MKKSYAMLLAACLATSSIYAQTDVLRPSGGSNPMGNGVSWLQFPTGGG
jgi:hypothetical protein